MSRPDEREDRAAEAAEDAAAAEVAEGEQETELAEARRRAEENWDRYLRAEADLENFRKRAVRLRDEAVERQRRDLLARMLELADNLERALAHSASDPAALTSGVEGTYRELTRMLGSEGVETIPALDEPFDPDVHEAVSVVPLPGAEQERVISVERTGYTVNGELLRPARVVVGAPAPTGAGE